MVEPAPADQPVISTVSVVVVDAARRVLLFLPENSNQAGWSLPTGEVRTGEDPESAARRIIATATGQAVDHLTGPIASPGVPDEGRESGVFFLCHAESFRLGRGQQVSNSAPGQWWSVEELPHLSGTLSGADLPAVISQNS